MTSALVAPVSQHSAWSVTPYWWPSTDKPTSPREKQFLPCFPLPSPASKAWGRHSAAPGSGFLWAYRPKCNLRSPSQAGLIWLWDFTSQGQCHIPFLLHQESPSTWDSRPDWSHWAQKNQVFPPKLDLHLLPQKSPTQWALPEWRQLKPVLFKSKNISNSIFFPASQCLLRSSPSTSLQSVRGWCLYSPLDN